MPAPTSAKASAPTSAPTSAGAAPPNNPVGANRLELLQIAEALAREKGIDRQLVIEAIAEALERAARALYGAENRIRASVDEKTGEIRMARLREVVERVESPALDIALETAQQDNPAARIGDMIAEDLPLPDFGRLAAHGAKQVLMEKVREAERDRQYEEYKDKTGEIANGIVRRIERGNVIVDLGRAEAVLRREDSLPLENFHAGDRIRAYIYDVRRELRGPQIFLSRANNEFMARLFAQEVPEIYDGVIEIKSIARDPGSRAKIAVFSHDSSIDPVGACVGMRGSRVQAVVNELQGEKVDIVRWSPDLADFVARALVPSTVVKVVLDEDTGRVEAVVPDEQLSLAIGSRGRSVRLAAQLTGWEINILTESEESERRQKEFAERSALFQQALQLEETTAQLLASEGFAEIEDIAYVEPSEIAQLEGFDDEQAAQLQANAIAFLQQQDEEWRTHAQAAGVEETLLAMEGVTAKMAMLFGKNDIKTLAGLADLAGDELTGWNEGRKPNITHHEGILETTGISKEQADALIMAARVQTGMINEEDLITESAPPEEAEAEAEAEAPEEVAEEAAAENQSGPNQPKAQSKAQPKEGQTG